MSESAFGYGDGDSDPRSAIAVGVGFFAVMVMGALNLQEWNSWIIVLLGLVLGIVGVILAFLGFALIEKEMDEELDERIERVFGKDKEA